MSDGWKAVEKLHRRFARERDLDTLEMLVQRAREIAASLEREERTRAEFYLRKMERDLKRWTIGVRRGMTP